MSEEMNRNINEQPNNATPAENGEQAGKMFTQDEVNKIVSDRLARERAKAEPKEDERERALREREKAVEAREARYKCEDYFAKLNIDERFKGKLEKDFFSALDTSDFDKFKAAVDILEKWFITKTEVIGTTTPNPVLSRPNIDAQLADAFKPKI